MPFSPAPWLCLVVFVEGAQQLPIAAPDHAQNLFKFINARCRGTKTDHLYSYVGRDHLALQNFIFAPLLSSQFRRRNIIDFVGDLPDRLGDPPPGYSEQVPAREQCG